MNIISSILKNNPCYKANKTITVKGLMLHSVGTAQPDATVFVKKWNNSNTKKCVHAFVSALDGKVYQTLPWNHRGWHCGSGSKGSANSTHIGIEMCEPKEIKYTTGSSFTISDKKKAQASAIIAYNSAVELFAYLCKQYKLDPLKNIISHKEAGKKGIASGHVDPEHLWKGLGLSYTMDKFRADVKKKMEAPAELPRKKTTTKKPDYIYKYLKGKFGRCGAIGIMANLYRESAFLAINMQNSYEKKLGYTDKTYTDAVDTGKYTDFTSDRVGYGICQWTSAGRKENLLKYAKETNSSVGNLTMQLEFLVIEIKAMLKLLNALKASKSAEQSAIDFMLMFERPENQSVENQKSRAQIATDLAKKYQ